jgi:hypothetical protein
VEVISGTVEAGRVVDVVVVDVVVVDVVADNPKTSSALTFSSLESVGTPHAATTTARMLSVVRAKMRRLIEASPAG